MNQSFLLVKPIPNTLLRNMENSAYWIALYTVSFVKKIILKLDFLEDDKNTQRDKRFKKVQAKKLMKSNFFSWNCISGNFKLFPSSKIDFWPFMKLQKIKFGQKISWNWFIWFDEFFCPGLFFNFLTQYGPLNKGQKMF